MKNLFFIISILSSISLFGQCDEYYINELVSGHEERYFPSGSPIRFCPKLKGVALNGYDFDVSQWSGISTQYLTLTKNGGITGNLVLSLDEKTLKVNFIGSPGIQLYSICLNKSELNNVMKKKDEIKILAIDSLVANNDFEGAFKIYNTLYSSSNYTHSSDLLKSINKLRREKLDIIKPKIDESINKKKDVMAAELFSEINFPENLEFSESRKYNNIKDDIAYNLKTIYKDSFIYQDFNFQFSKSDSDFELYEKGKKIEFNRAIQNHLDSLTDGEYYIKISYFNDYKNTLKYEIVAEKFGLRFSEKDGSIIAETYQNSPALKQGFPNSAKISSIDGKNFQNANLLLDYISNKKTINIDFFDPSSNGQKTLTIKRGFLTVQRLPIDQSECIRWQYGGGCAEYYYVNLLDGFKRDSLKSKQVGVFSIETPVLVKFTLKKNIINVKESVYYTKKGEKLKYANNKYYRKVKGEKSTSVKTEVNEDISSNQIVVGVRGDLQYIINNEVNYLVNDRILYSEYPINDFYSKDKN
jgi:C-terminal processing protease CtpA/Prc